MHPLTLLLIPLLLLPALALPYALCSPTSTDCLPCPTECAACSSQSQCSSCDIQYYYSTNSTSNCISCPENCLSCMSSTTCTNCMNPYVLSNNTCALCVIQYALSCSSTVAATACQSGYYLSDSYCSSCLLNCITCSSAYDCSACTDGYYLNTSIITCNPCPQGCSNCNQYVPSQCTVCTNGYTLSSTSCLPVICPIPNCLYCSTPTVCSRCSPLYYWNGNECLAGGSVNCEKGAVGPLPVHCINSCSSFTYKAQVNGSSFECKTYPSIYVTPIEYHQYYYYAYNHLQQLIAITTTNNALALEDNGEYSYLVENKISLQAVPNYYRLQVAIKYVMPHNATLTINATTPTNNLQTESHSINSSSSPLALIINSTVVHSNNLNLVFSSPISII